MYTKRRKSSDKLGHASTSFAKPNNHGSKLLLCIWWDQQDVIYYELHKTNETITEDRYRLQFMRLSQSLKEKRPLYAQRHDKVILLHDNARPHVAKPVIILKYRLYITDIVTKQTRKWAKELLEDELILVSDPRLF